MPRPGNGSPIVAAGRVFFTSAQDADGRRRSLYCLDPATGKRIWSRTIEIDRKMSTHKTNPYCATTPASDGKRVVVWHGSAGLHCYDIDGKEQWKLDLGEFKHKWGYATSPVIDGDQVILFTGPGKEPFVAAYDLKTGKQRWRKVEAIEGMRKRNTASTFYGSWSTPILTRAGGKKQLIASMPTRVLALSPETGRELWSCRGVNQARGDLAYSSPIIAGDLCFVTSGFRGPSLAIRLGGSGNVTKTHCLWRTERSPRSIGTGMYVNGYIYRSNGGPGGIDCIEPKTGKILWTDRAGGREFWGSMVRAGGHLMVTNQEGATIVFKPSPEAFKAVSTNRLDEVCNATPAVANGQIFIRTYKHLYCIGKIVSYGAGARK